MTQRSPVSIASIARLIIYPTFVFVDITKQVDICYLSQPSEIPEQFSSSNTWNCSVPHWPRFQRHFRCNMRQECVSGEDEVQCPYSPCSHGGVRLGRHCYFLAETYTAISWNEAQQKCRKQAAYLASLTSPREWSDVMSWLRLRIPSIKYHVYIGLASVPPNFPFM